jgi:exo-beta-1,3-glucanase (GH17 family)
MPTLPAPSAQPAVRLLSAALLGSILLLAACGGGGTIPSPGVNPTRALPTAVMQQKAVAYSPYRSANRDSETITKAMIEQDLLLLQQAGIGLIRLFDASDAVARQTLEVIAAQQLPIKVMLGMYVNPNTEAANQAELDRGIALAKAHPNTVVALSVGNETLVSWSFVPQDVAVMAGYLRKVRAAVSQPVTTDDNWAFFANAQGVKPPAAVLAEIDFVAMHSYPLLDTIHNPQLWDWKQTGTDTPQRATAMMDAAVARLQFEYRAVRQHLNTSGYDNLPIIVGETGWKAEPSGGETQRAHPVNQKMYFDRLETWKASGTGPLTVVHFAAFDEPWKQGDDKWGLFNVQRQARCVAQALNANLSKAAGSCDASAALHYEGASNAGPVTASRFTVSAETTTAGEARPSGTVLLNAWENGTTASATELDASSGDGSKAIQITPTPASWGWGMTWGVSGTETDLSNFAGSSARLNFRIKTTYTGKLEVGFLTGSTLDSSAFDVYLPMAPGSYGYQNDGNWHSVSIPVADISARGAPAFNMPASASLQMNRISNLFVIADRFAVTGNTAGAKPVVWIDDIHWSR